MNSKSKFYWIKVLKKLQKRNEAKGQIEEPIKKIAERSQNNLQKEKSKVNFEIPIKNKTNKSEVIYKRKSKDQVRIEVPTKESPKLN